MVKDTDAGGGVDKNIGKEATVNHLSKPTFPKKMDIVRGSQEPA